MTRRVPLKTYISILIFNVLHLLSATCSCSPTLLKMAAAVSRSNVWCKCIPTILLYIVKGLYYILQQKVEVHNWFYELSESPSLISNRLGSYGACGGASSSCVRKVFTVDPVLTWLLLGSSTFFWRERGWTHTGTIGSWATKATVYIYSLTYMTTWCFSQEFWYL